MSPTRSSDGRAVPSARVILGLHASFWHDPAAVLVVDRRLVAGLEEERCTRVKHAPWALPVQAALGCLELANLTAEDVDLVVYSWSPDELRSTRFDFLTQHIRRGFGPFRRAGRSVLRERRLTRQRLARLDDTCRAIGIADRVPREHYQHHHAHAASAFATSGYERAAILSIDGMSDRVTALAAEGVGAEMIPRYRALYPDSLGLFYSSFTDFLGFGINDGEYKVMGMASYGDPDRFDLGEYLQFDRGRLRLDSAAIVVPRRRRWRGRSFGADLVDRFGEPRTGDALDDPHPDLAASVQRHFERAVFALLDEHLDDVLRRTGRLCLAGGCALNVALNRRLIADPRIDELFVPPAPHDPGTAVGAVALALARRGQRLEPRPSPYLGLEVTSDTAREALERVGVPFVRVADPCRVAAELLADGEVVGWCQGRMEWGPRALGHRSILGHPGRAGTSDEINRRVKFRETWRPFCPSVLAERADELFESDHTSPHMTYAFRATESARQRMSEVVHVDGTLRPQTVTAEASPRFHRLLLEFAERTGLPALINTSLNRRGEPMVATAEDALAMFHGSGLEHLFIEDHYVVKDARRLETLSDGDIAV